MCDRRAAADCGGVRGAAGRRRHPAAAGGGAGATALAACIARKAVAPRRTWHRPACGGSITISGWRQRSCRGRRTAVVSGRTPASLAAPRLCSGRRTAAAEPAAPSLPQQGLGLSWRRLGSCGSARRPCGSHAGRLHGRGRHPGAGDACACDVPRHFHRCTAVPAVTGRTSCVAVLITCLNGAWYAGSRSRCP